MPVGQSNSPHVSVIIPVYNREHLVGAAVDSILLQTFADFELIIVDDGSSDRSVEQATVSGDPRLRVVGHEANRGIVAARNTGLEAARGEYIAWLDSDDVARPERLEKQLAFLRARPDIVMVGSAAGKLRAGGQRGKGARIPPLCPADISAWLLFRSAFQQSSVTGRAAVLKEYPYRAQFDVCEDLDVFLRLSREHRLANLPDVLIDRRVHDGQMVRAHQARIRTRKEELYGSELRQLGMTFSHDDLERHTLLGKAKLDAGLLPPGFLDWADDWLRTMVARNRESCLVDPDGLQFAAGWFWMLACRVAIPETGRAGAARRCLRSPLASGIAGSHGRAWLTKVLPSLLHLPHAA